MTPHPGTGSSLLDMETPDAGPGDPVRIEILFVPDCPLVGRVRDTLDRVLPRVDVPVEVHERVGAYRSPTLLIDGRDVTGMPPGEGSACRLDLPTEAQILAALRRVR